MPTKLSDLVDPNKSAWVEWKEGIEIKLKYLSRSELKRLFKNCTVTRYDKNHQKEETLDHEKFKRLIAPCIQDWRGFTLGTIKSLKLFPLNTDAEEMDTETSIPCDPANRQFMLDEAYEFDDFVLETCKTLQTQAEQEEEGELKN